MTTLLDRQSAFAGTAQPVAALRLDETRLAKYLREHVAGFRGPMTVAQFRGGQSNPTYLIDAASGRYVLRRKPPGRLLPSAHAVDREYRVTMALRARGFPVARPLLLCHDETVIGTEFYLMDFVAGRIFWEPRAPGLGGEDRRALFASLNETIATLHRIPLDGLEDLGKPRGYVARQVTRWSEQYRASETETIEAMDQLTAWLPGAVPRETDATLVHGDFRLDNCIVHPSEPRIVAVLDWELATIGDPVADFTYHLMQWYMPPPRAGGGVGSLIGHLNEPGIPPVHDYMADYCRRTGRSEIPHLNVYLAYNFFRLAAILQGIAGRVRDGTAANAHAAAQGQEVRPLAETAWAFALKAGA